jgi:hypothetical protein
MKKLLSRTGVMILGSLFLIAGCTKEAQYNQPPPPPCPSCPLVDDSGIYYLIISNWTKVSNTGVYTSAAGTLTPPKGASESPQVNVYLLYNSKEISINNRVSFMGGSLWTDINGLNVKLVYRDESSRASLPFNSLNIKIEIK